MRSKWKEIKEVKLLKIFSKVIEIFSKILGVIFFMILFNWWSGGKNKK